MSQRSLHSSLGMEPETILSVRRFNHHAQQIHSNKTKTTYTLSFPPTQTLLTTPVLQKPHVPHETPPDITVYHSPPQ